MRHADWNSYYLLYPCVLPRTFKNKKRFSSIILLPHIIITCTTWHHHTLHRTTQLHDFTTLHSIKHDPTYCTLSLYNIITSWLTVYHSTPHHSIPLHTTPLHTTTGAITAFKIISIALASILWAASSGHTLSDLGPIMESSVAVWGLLYTGLVTTAAALWVQSYAFEEVCSPPFCWFYICGSFSWVIVYNLWTDLF